MWSRNFRSHKRKADGERFLAVAGADSHLKVNLVAHREGRQKSISTAVDTLLFRLALFEPNAWSVAKQEACAFLGNSICNECAGTEQNNLAC